MSITLPPPPREKTSPEQEGQWRETLWRTVKELRTDLDSASADITTLQAFAARFGDWSTYTPSITASGGGHNSGASAIKSGFYRRIGDSIEVAIAIRVNGAGYAAGTGTYSFSLPASLTIDGAKVPSASAVPILGHGMYFDDSTSTAYSTLVEYNDSTTVKMRTNAASSSGFVGAAAPAAMAAGDYYNLKFTVPITGYGS